jgi:hypothetical protein
MTHYYVVYCTDGPPVFRRYSESALKKALANNDFGKDPHFWDGSIAIGLDAMQPGTLVIIKGEAVIPRPIKTVTEYSLEED